MDLMPLFLFISLLLMLFNCCYIQPAISRHQHNNITDREALLSFKADITDPTGILTTNWSSDTSFCNWIGVSCSLKHMQRVTSVRLFNMSLHGTISPYLGNLSFLSTLLLHTNSLTGPIPESLSHLPRLTKLVLENNFLSGSIPFAILNMSSLTNFSVAKNNLTGFLPSNNNNSFSMLPGIQKISLSINYFSGEVPSSFAHCLDLKLLSLSRNQFSGSIPVEIGSLPELRTLYLGKNQLTGTIPTSLGNLTKLIELDLGHNNLTGVIPDELGNLSNLQYLGLSENDLGKSIPTALLNASLLQHLALYDNKLTGSVPIGIGRGLPELIVLHLGTNQLTGGLEFLSSLSNCNNLMLLAINQNHLQGSLPDSVGNLSKTVQYIYTFENHIKGKIPISLFNLTGLILLSLFENELEGPIPSTLTKLTALSILDFSDNKIRGSIPYELGPMISLSDLSLEYNLISGLIPDSLANLSMLQYLDLSNNKLSSNIPPSLWTLGSLLVLSLSRNTLHGTLPQQYINMNSLITLDLSMNKLSGNITSAFEDLKMVQYLDLSRNSLHGQIPISFGNLISVTYLNLSHNFLSGVIPKSLANLTTLESLDLSFNKLGGQVPSGSVFSNTSIPILIGNEALCGAPQLDFPPCPTDVISNNSKRKLLLLKYILMATASTVVLLTCFCLIYISYRRRKVVTEVDDTDINASFLPYRVVSHHELVRATSNFSDANLLGKGGFGAVYKGCLDDGIIIAVKVLNLEVEAASRSFDAECQCLRGLRHRNLIKIITVCSNLDFKALVLEFMPNGNLETWLYSDNCYLNLLQRLNIMLDVASAVEYLHHHHLNLVLHCDLKPTNVLLDEEMVAHVSDFGIAKLLLGDGPSIATASIPGTIGYIAPEYASTGQVSRMGDVYSFGILLLELFTRKRPSDGMFGEEYSLRGWVCRAYPTAVSDVVDYRLLNDHSNNEETLQTQTAMHQCLSHIFELGLLCSRFSPKERIPMTDVVVRLQKIKIEYLSLVNY